MASERLLTPGAGKHRDTCLGERKGKGKPLGTHLSPARRQAGIQRGWVVGTIHYEDISSSCTFLSMEGSEYKHHDVLSPFWGESGV